MTSDREGFEAAAHDYYRVIRDEFERLIQQAGEARTEKRFHRP